MKARIGVVLWWSWIAMAVCAPVARALPNTISHQGFLTDLAGTPREGPVSMKFSLFDAATGGSPLWTETHTVAVEDGVFFVSLGSVATLQPSLFSGAPLWLETSVNDTTLAPRQPIGTVPLAFRAAIADSAAASALGSTVESEEITDNTITDADIAAGAGIAGTKIAPNFGYQEVRTTGDVRGATARMTGFEMRTGAQAGHVLTSDGGGVASWQPPAASVGGSGTPGTLSRFVSGTTLGNSSLVEASGSIGLGTSSPSARLHVIAGGAGQSVAWLQGVVGQSAPLLSIRDFGGIQVASINAAGAFAGNGAGMTGLDANNLASGTVPNLRLGGTYSNPLTFTNGGNSFVGSGAGMVNLNASNLVTGSLNPSRLPASGTWSLAGPLALNSGAGILLYNDANSARVGVGTSSPQAKLHIIPPNPATTGLVVQGSMFGQTSNLQEWVSTAGTVLGLVNSAGILTINGAGVTNLNAANLVGAISPGNLPSGGAWALSSPLSIDAGTLYVDPSSNRIGIGTTSPTKALTIEANGADYEVTTSGSSNLDITTAGGIGGAISISAREASSFGITVTTANDIGIGTVTPTDKLQVNGTFSATGMKNALVPTTQGMTRLYSEESSEVWFSDYGSGRLADGRARIDLDPLFLETVTVLRDQPLKVFVQLKDDCRGVYVKPDARGFEVIELQSGRSDAAFDFRVAAKRRGYEGQRLARAPQP